MRSLRFASALFLALALAAPVAVAAGPTTLDRTIVATGEGSFEFGPGEPHMTRTLGIADPGGVGRPLTGFKHVSDHQVVDEESPGRIEYFDNCPGPFESGYRPQEAATTQVADSMLRRLRRIKEGPATGVALSRLISTGDSADNSQKNETRWLIRLMDGATVDPNSGDETYDGYTQEQYTGAWPNETLELANEPFDAVGARQPWYLVMGNHDELVQGNALRSDTFQGLVMGDRKVFASVDAYDDCPATPDEAGAKASLAFISRGRAVPADPARKFLLPNEVIAQYFKTTGKPVGHGFNLAPDDPLGEGPAAYYPLSLHKKVKMLALDSTARHFGDGGALDHPQFEWLERKLTAWSKTYYDTNGELVQNPDGRNKLVVIMSHHTSSTLHNPATDEAGSPYHCFDEATVPQYEGTCADGEGLGTLLARFPNVIGWVNGHQHQNEVRAWESPDPADPSRAYWEITTAAHIDWPQQSRLVEIAWLPGEAGDTAVIYGTIVDHAAPLTPDLATQSPVNYLAALARAEAYYDACVLTTEGKQPCDGAGDLEDRNVRLLTSVPFDIGT